MIELLAKSLNGSHRVWQSGRRRQCFVAGWYLGLPDKPENTAFDPMLVVEV
jgi:hypothetical protein